MNKRNQGKKNKKKSKTKQKDSLLLNCWNVLDMYSGEIFTVHYLTKIIYKILSTNISGVNINKYILGDIFFSCTIVQLMVVFWEVTEWSPHSTGIHLEFKMAHEIWSSEERSAAKESVSIINKLLNKCQVWKNYFCKQIYSIYSNWTFEFF